VWLARNGIIEPRGDTGYEVLGNPRALREVPRDAARCLDAFIQPRITTIFASLNAHGMVASLSERGASASPSAAPVRDQHLIMDELAQRLAWHRDECIALFGPNGHRTGSIIVDWLATQARTQVTSLAEYVGAHDEVRVLGDTGSTPSQPGSPTPTAEQAEFSAASKGHSGSTHPPLTPSQMNAYRLDQWARQQRPDLETDRELYDYLASRDEIPGELPPKFSTFTRYLSAARQHYGELKHRPRRGREPGGGIARSKDI
jgi:hypothetical protein